MSWWDLAEAFAFLVGFIGCAIVLIAHLTDPSTLRQRR